MLKAGITGGIGSGKSTVCRLFALLGIPVYDADSRAKWLMTGDPQLVAAVKKNFGSNMYAADGTLNRQALAARVFSDTAQLQLLNSLVHPAVLKDHEAWHRKQQNVPYTLKEAALLFESGSYKKLDTVILVSAPEELRIQRAMQRDGSTREAIVQRLKNQLSEGERKKRSDHIILNDGEHSLIEQVLRLHHELSQA